MVLLFLGCWLLAPRVRRESGVLHAQSHCAPTVPLSTLFLLFILTPHPSLPTHLFVLVSRRSTLRLRPHHPAKSPSWAVFAEALCRFPRTLLALSTDSFLNLHSYYSVVSPLLPQLPVFNERRFTSSAESTTIMRAIGVFLCTRKDILVLARISYKVRAKTREVMGETMLAFSPWRSYILGNFYFPSRKGVSEQRSRSVGNRREIFRNCQ